MKNVKGGPDKVYPKARVTSEKCALEFSSPAGRLLNDLKNHNNIVVAFNYNLLTFYDNNFYVYFFSVAPIDANRE